MKYRIIMIISLMLLTLVLIGVTLVEPISKNYIWLQPITPMIVISGFFTFLVSVALFIFSVVKNIK